MEIAPRKSYLWIGFFFCVLLWLYFLFWLPTFDLDESLYRRVAEDMKIRGDYWHPYWDMIPLLHKPPILYWLINLASRLIDTSTVDVSVAAARLPGLAIALALSFFMRPSRGLFLWLSPFPLLTVCAVIFDPLQSLFLLPSILIPNRWFKEDRTGTHLEYLGIALSLFFACAIKGLNGLVIPSFAILMHLLIRNWNVGIRKLLQEATRFILLSLLAALFLSGAYYYYLDLKMGRDFTREFFLVHHLGRSQSAMEEHGGGIFYYVLVFILGSGASLPYFVAAGTSLKHHFVKVGFPITFLLSFIFIFSLSATKLPHYLWPAWPAIALFMADRKPKILTNRMLLVSHLPSLLLSLSCLLLSVCTLGQLRALSSSPQFHAIMREDYQIQLWVRACYLFSGVLGLTLFLKRQSWFLRPDKTFAVSSAALLAFAIATGTILTECIQAPIDAISADTNALKLNYGTCIMYAGNDSPSLSLALGHNLFPNRCTIEETVYLITPDWKLDQCIENKIAVISHRGYLTLCGPKQLQLKK